MRIGMQVVWSVVLAAVLTVCGCNDQNEKMGRTETGGAVESFNKPLPSAQRKRILVLHSYHPEYAWVEDVNNGIVKGLAEERFDPDKNIIIEYFYMDTKRQSAEKWKLEVARRAIEKITSWQPDVVIAADDNAQKYVVAPLKDSGINFVFLGVNADPLNYGFIGSMEKPGGTISGSIERARFGQTVRLLQRLVPGTRRIAIVCDDGATGGPILKRVLAQAEELGVEIVSSRMIGRFSEWQEYVRSVQDKADALLVVVYHTLKDDAGEPVDENRVLNWTINNSRLPDIGFWSWAVEAGLLCSEAISGFQQGFYAATVASYVLSGQSPGEFPVDKPQRGEMCINLARAEMLGIEVPADLQRSATVSSAIASAGTEAKK